MADERELTVRLRAQIDSYVQGMSRASRATQEFGRELTGHGKSSREEIEKVGRSALIMSGVLAGGLALSAKAAVDWESSFAGVTKTVDGTATQIAALEQGLRDMATELPASHGEIAAVAEAAGQLGIKVGDVESFTKVMIDLGETTNLTADQAATSLARIANIMGTSASEVDRMGSTIVELGNNSATTEAEIVELATRLAAAGKIAGLTEADVFAFASTLTSVGVEAEAGGTALSKVFTAIRDAVLSGGDSLETFAEVAGVSTSKFSAAFREDAAGAIQMFISGLGEMNDKGQSTTAVFEDLELADQRLMRALLSTASAGDLLTDQLGMAADAWDENIALQTEAEKRYATTGAQLEMLRNKVVDLGIGLGDTLLPLINGLADGLGSVATGVGELPGPMDKVAVSIAGIATAGLGAVGIIGTFGPKIKETKKALEGMGSAGSFAARNMGKFAGGLAVAGIAVAALSWYMGEQAKKQMEAEEAARGYTEAILDQGSAVGALTDEVALQAILEGKLGESLRQSSVDLAVFSAGLRDISTQQIDDLRESFDDLITFGALRGDEVKAMEKALRDAGLAGTDLGNALMFLASESDLTDEQLQSLLNRLKDQSVAHRDGAREADNQAAATGSAGTAAGDATAPTDTYTAALDDQSDAAETLADRIKALQDAYEAPLQPIFEMQDALAGVNEHAENVRDAQQDLADAQRDAVSAAAEIEDAQIDVAKAMSVTADEAEAARRGIQNLADEQRSAVDPLFAMLAALEKQAELLDDPDATDLDVARGAADVTSAATRLAGNILTGDTSVAKSKAMLAAWVDQGLITADQAANVAEQFGVAATKAQELQGANVAGAASAEVAAERLRVEQERAEAVAEAQERVRDASERAAAAQERVAEAAEAVTEAQGGGERAAMDLMLAAIGLSAVMKENPRIVGEAKQRIEEFADAGLITRDAADLLTASIDDAAEAARNYAGNYVATMDLDTREFWRKFAELQAASTDTRYQAQLDNPYATTPGFQLAAGGIMSFAGGGTTGAHIAQNQVVKYAEPQTGGEAYIPRFGDTKRSLGILQEAAGWYGTSIGGGAIDYTRLAQSMKGMGAEVAINLNGGDHDPQSIARHVAWALT